MPVRSGIRTSSSTRSGVSCCASLRAGTPASASITWYPHSSHFWRSDQRTRRSSSTIMIFSAGTVFNLLRNGKSLPTFTSEQHVPLINQHRSQPTRELYFGGLRRGLCFAETERIISFLFPVAGNGVLD